MKGTRNTSIKKTTETLRKNTYLTEEEEVIEEVMEEVKQEDMKKITKSMAIDQEEEDKIEMKVIEEDHGQKQIKNGMITPEIEDLEQEEEVVKENQEDTEEIENTAGRIKI